MKIQALRSRRINSQWTLIRSMIVTCAMCATMLLAGGGSSAQSTDVPSCCRDRWDPASEQRGKWEPGTMGPGQRQRMARRRIFMHEGIPGEYRDQKNPHDVSPDTIDKGRAIYQLRCAICHGSQGYGDGEIANSLNPSPALLAYMVRMPMAVDEHLLWSISEGGKPVESGMPAYKDDLSRDEIWKVIAYLRAGLPPTTAANSDYRARDKEVRFWPLPGPETRYGPL